MKRTRVAQQRAMEREKKRFRSEVMAKSREIMALRRKSAKDESILRKVQTQGMRKVSTGHHRCT